MKRLLTIGHSYVVALNRRLAHELAVQGRGSWEVTAVAPTRFAGDLRAIALERVAGEACGLAPVDVHLDSFPHLMFYGRGLRAIAGRPWDVVHCWEEPYVAAGFQVARLAPRSSRFVFATFQNIVKRYPPPLRAFERRVVSRADGWIAFGETVRQAHADRDSYRSRPSAVIPPGVDVASFAPDSAARRAIRARLGWEDDVPVVGFLGRFVPAKGVDVLTAVLPRLRSRWRVLFVGGGPCRRDLERFAASYPGRVAIADAVPHDEVPAWLNAMDVLCAPSQTTARWREQFGRMTIEAMACGVPVVASDSGEIPHAVGGAGVVVGERDLDGWRRALDALLEDEPRRRTLSAAGLARAREVFAWPVIARRHLEFFDRVLDGGRGEVAG